MHQFGNKTVDVTGASRGIGKAAARHFTEAGAHVVLAARTEARIAAIADEIITAGGSATAIPRDVSQPDDVEHLIDKTHADAGAIDVLIDNAGLIEPIARLVDSDPRSWGQIVDINLKGVYHGLRQTIPRMVRAGGGTIINISSGAATGAPPSARWEAPGLGHPAMSRCGFPWKRARACPDYSTRATHDAESGTARKRRTRSQNAVTSEVASETKPMIAGPRSMPA